MRGSINKILLTLALLLTTYVLSSGQTGIAFTQYVLNPMSINPAYAGGQDALNFSLFYGKQWVGVEGSPKTMVFSADAPLLNRKLGLGLMVVNEQFGISKQNEIVTNYAYKIRMPKSVLSFGIGANIRLANSSYHDLVALDPGDDRYMQDSKTYSLANFSFGVHYQVRNFFAGISIPQLLNYHFDINQDKYISENDFNAYRYMLNAGYKFRVSNHIDVSPSMLLQYASHDVTQSFLYDMNMIMCYRDIFCVGGSYRNDRSFATLFQIKPSKQISMAYSFNFETSQLNRHTNGSHEIMLKYIFKYKVIAPNPLIF